jgi:transcription elongation factor GreA
MAAPTFESPQLSRASFARLKAEHDDLTTRGRFEIAQAIERAREMGDLSENGDYHAAKDQQGMMEGRIRQLHKLLEEAEVIDDVPEGVVGTGTIVTFVYEGDDDDMAERYLVGHIEEKTGDLDVLSPQAPLGSALVGAVVGDTVSYQAPGGALRVKVLKVERA